MAQVKANVGDMVRVTSSNGNVFEGEISAKKGAWLTLILEGGSTRRVRGKVELLNQGGADEEAKDQVDEGKGYEPLVKPDHSRYKRGLGVTVSGNRTYDIDDEVAEILRGMHINDVYEYVARCAEAVNGENFDEVLADLRRRYDGLKTKAGTPNYGMMRMNLGNRLRALMRRAAEEGIQLPAL